MTQENPSRESLEARPEADLFPLMSGDELQALAEDIKANGLRQPIVLSDGEILDGRNRYRACQLAGVAPEFTEADGGDPLALVVSLNVKRRNLSKGQLAVAAAEAWGMAVEEGKALEGSGKRSDLAKSSGVVQAPADHFGALFGVSAAYVKQARALVQHAPEAAEAVKNGAADLRGSYELYREERERLDALEKEREELRDRLEAITQATATLDLMAPPAEEELLPVDADTVKRSVAQSMPKTDLAEPTPEIKSWDAALKATSDAAAAIRQLPVYPSDADDLLGLTVRSVARALGDAAARLLAALPSEETSIRRVK
jgi:hypothetical protein